MNLRTLGILFFLVLITACCKDPEVGECKEDACFNLSDLETKTDYLLPFILYNDQNAELRKVTLNGEEVAFDYGYSLTFDKSGFYELELTKDNAARTKTTYIFTLGTEERQPAEWGIEAWVPKPFTTGSLDADEIRSLYPRRYVAGMAVPFIFYVMKNGVRVDDYYLANSSSSGEDFYIKHGVGSILLSGNELGEDQQFLIDDQSVQLSLAEITGTLNTLGGAIDGDVSLAANSVTRITGDLTIPAGASLTLNEGALLLVDEAVNIYNEGPVYMNGTSDNPVFITCKESGKYWGGFISTGSGAAINASYTILCQSGYHADGDYASWGHAKRQGLFYTKNSALTLDHCYMTDHIGQVFYPLSSTLNFRSILVQRAKTSGQLNYCEAEIRNSIFTDFPNDDYSYLDIDNDALYINTSNVTIDSCIFMFAKDDGLDSGADGGGTVRVSNCLFEACFHEGTALSSSGDVVKNHIFENCTFYNCGQGMEMGFSSPNHQLTAYNCLFLENGIGIRYGDNYNWSSVNGYMEINNSQSLNNTKDVWNMVRNLWAPRLDHLRFNNVQVSAPVPQYPDLEVISN